MDSSADGPRRLGVRVVDPTALSELAPLVEELKRAADAVARLAMSIEACIDNADVRGWAHPDGDGDGAVREAAALDLVGRAAHARRLVGPVAIHGFHVDPGRHTVRFGERQALLTPNEWQLFAMMLAEPGRTFTREELATGAWGRGYGGRDSEVEVYISRLRRKLEADPRSPLMIETVRGCGYRLVPPEDGGPGLREALAGSRLELGTAAGWREEQPAS